jgi:hypothetical protein
MFPLAVGPRRKKTVVHLEDLILLLVREDSAMSAIKMALPTMSVAAVSLHLNG